MDARVSGTLYFETSVMRKALSAHFRRREFECRCGCGFDTIDTETLDVLEAVREQFGRIRVTSGARCPAHNAAIGGVKKSQHLLGRAADIAAMDADADTVQEWLISNFPEASIGRYDDFTHIDTRTEGPARWDRRSKA